MTGTALRRMRTAPKNGAMKVPTELKACARLRRLDAVLGGPMTVT